MSRATLEEKIKSLPDAYIEDVALFIDYVVFRGQNEQSDKATNLMDFFGCISLPDGMNFQKEVRDEWN